MSDQLHRYIFNSFPARCLIVKLTHSWQDCHAHCDYDATARDLLGRCLAATALMAGNLKFSGKLTLQMGGDGPLSLLVTQADHTLGLRGMVKLTDELDLEHPLKGCQVSVIGEIADSNETYQGIVPTAKGTLASNLEGYFSQSEQLPTRLWLAANEKVATGLMLQAMPAEQDPDGRQADADGWNRIQKLAETIGDDELLNLDADSIAHRLFHQEELVRLDTRPTRFKCGCSHERVSAMIKGLGQADAEELLAEQGQISVTCEFCNRVYEYDAVDTAQIFTAEPSAPTPEQLQ